MKYTRFEDLPVWQHAQDLGERIFRLVDDAAFNRRGDLRNQMERAVTSISNNIAEGFEQGTTESLITYLYYARGSAGEVRSMLHLCGRMPWFSRLRSEISNLKMLSEAVSRQLGAWVHSLQNSPIEGQRYLNDATSERFDRKRRADAFIKKLEAIRRGQADHSPEGSPGPCDQGEHEQSR